MCATLVTGGAGYIGSHVVMALHQSGHKVVILDDFSTSSPYVIDALRNISGISFTTVEGDAADRSLLKKVFRKHNITSVIHLAAYKIMSESLVEPLRYYNNNLASTIRVAEAAVEHGVKRLVFSSSAAVYGMPEVIPVTENSPRKPISPYGQSKLMSEQILTDCASSSHLEVVMLRYFNPAGAHPSGLIGEEPTTTDSSLVSRIMKTVLGRCGPVKVFGNGYNTKDGTPIRDFIHVVDLAEGHLVALRSDNIITAGRSMVYNLGTGVGSTVLDVLNAAETAIGRSVAYEIAERRPGDVPSIWADCRKANRELGWSAQHDLITTLSDHWNWRKHNPDGYSG